MGPARVAGIVTYLFFLDHGSFFFCPSDRGSRRRGPSLWRPSSPRCFRFNWAVRPLPTVAGYFDSPAPSGGGLKSFRSFDRTAILILCNIAQTLLVALSFLFFVVIVVLSVYVSTSSSESHGSSHLGASSTRPCGGRSGWSSDGSASHPSRDTSSWALS